MDISLCSVVFAFYEVDCFMCCGILIIFCSLFFYNAAHHLVSSFSGVLFMFDVFFLFISAVGFSLYVVVLSLDWIRIALYCVIE